MVNKATKANPDANTTAQRSMAMDSFAFEARTAVWPAGERVVAAVRSTMDRRFRE